MLQFHEDIVIKPLNLICAALLTTLKEITCGSRVIHTGIVLKCLGEFILGCPTVMSHLLTLCEPLRRLPKPKPLLKKNQEETIADDIPIPFFLIF